MSVSDIISLLLELFSWIGLTLGLLCLTAALIARAASGRWGETTAVLMPSSEAVVARWMAEDGTIFSRSLEPHELHRLPDDDAVTVYFSLRRPEAMRLHRRGGAERALMLLALILGGIGLLASAVALAMGFIVQ